MKYDPTNNKGVDPDFDKWHDPVGHEDHVDENLEYSQLCFEHNCQKLKKDSPLFRKVLEIYENMSFLRNYNTKGSDQVYKNLGGDKVLFQAKKELKSLIKKSKKQGL